MTQYLKDPTGTNTGDFGNEKDRILFKRVQEEKREKKKFYLLSMKASTGQATVSLGTVYKHYNSLLLPVDLSG